MKHTKLNVAALGLIRILSVTVAGSARAADTRLVDAVRSNDTRAAAQLLRAGADPNTRDSKGATALMYAAAFASLDCMRILLDSGASVNDSSGGGATALMWATADVAKVRLLLDRGAAAGARLKDGTTALVTAARRGNTEVMRLLMARGSEPKASAAETAELLRIAYGEHPEIRQILAAAGIELKDLASKGSPSLTTFPSVSNAALVQELLDIGVNPNPRGRFPIVAAAAFQGHGESVRLLIERGANPNAKSQQDVTLKDATVELGAPVPLFSPRIWAGLSGYHQQYDVARDGRFLINVTREETATSPITILLNWKPSAKPK